MQMYRVVSQTKRGNILCVEDGIAPPASLWFLFVIKQVWLWIPFTIRLSFTP